MSNKTNESTKSIPMTKSGFERLKTYLQELENKSLEITKAIEDALRHGDLSENAEYQSARQNQDFNNARMADVRSKIASAEIIDTSQISGDTVRFGAKIILSDQNGERKSFQIVGETESDIDKGLLSCTSPIGLALMNQKKGSYISVSLPSGEKVYRIEDVSFE